MGEFLFKCQLSMIWSQVMYTLFILMISLNIMNTTYKYVNLFINTTIHI